MMEKGVQRWVVDISTWDPSTDDFSYALSLLPQHHHSSITSSMLEQRCLPGGMWPFDLICIAPWHLGFSRFVNKDDRKRALISWLLQYALVHEVLGIPYHEIVIKRTLEGKPFLECGRVCLDFPNFNFNVSHHGDYVAIASETLCLVGLDIVSHVIPEKETVLEFIQNFSSCFSSLEWDQIVTAGSNDEVLTEFYSPRSSEIQITFRAHVVEEKTAERKEDEGFYKPLSPNSLH
ncbi:hypothetical protein QQP08_011147 [Theobroma cacao]|nr:hypothetical protein QQP08_011147 [Theobroma cacao]